MKLLERKDLLAALSACGFDLSQPFPGSGRTTPLCEASADECEAYLDHWTNRAARTRTAANRIAYTKSINHPNSL